MMNRVLALACVLLVAPAVFSGQTKITNISGNVITLSNPISQNIPIGTVITAGTITTPTGCLLVPAVLPTLDLGSPISPIDLSCHYAFPQVYLAPPIYNAPQTFIACQDFNAMVDISLQNAITGGIAATSTSAPHCGVAIVGALDVQACQSFTATSNFTVTGAAHGSLSVAGSNAPDCGVAINGNIDVQACESFQSTVSFYAPKSMAGSTFTAVSSSATDCGIDLDLRLNLNACEKITTKIKQNYPPAMAGSSINWLTPSAVGPDCPLELDINLMLDACTKFTAEAAFTVSGMASGYLHARPVSAPNCGVYIDGNINVPKACQTITGGGQVTVGGQLASGGVSITTSECGVNIDGNITVNCPSGGGMITAGKGLVGGASFTGGCNPTISGSFALGELDFCQKMTAGGNIKVINGAAADGLSVSSDGDCGVKIDGQITLPSFNFSTLPIIGSAGSIGFNAVFNAATNTWDIGLVGALGGGSGGGYWRKITLCENGTSTTMEVLVRGASPTPTPA
jgi:hypothetical protein